MQGRSPWGRLAAVTILVSLAAPPAAHAVSLLTSYGNEAECAASHILSTALCASAFAAARREFEARTRAFANRTACAAAFGSCAPWPPGTRGRVPFRPVFNGVEIVDTPHEKSVTPVLAGAHHSIAFAPQPLTAAPAPARQAAFRPSPGRRLRPPAAGTLPPASAPPPPGSGFTLKNGVLTFPAPVRFAPRNLPQQP